MNCCLPVSVWVCGSCHARETPNVFARINGEKISIGPRNKRAGKRAREKWEKKIKRTDGLRKLCNMEKGEEGDEWWKGGLINDTGKNTGEMGKEYKKEIREGSERMMAVCNVKKREDGRGLDWRWDGLLKGIAKKCRRDWAGDNVRTGYTSEERKWWNCSDCNEYRWKEVTKRTDEMYAERVLWRGELRD
jgi:hypothetical protein